MPKAEDLQPDGIFRGLFVGKSGSGKTGAACSFPEFVEDWDFDGRIRGLLGTPWVDRKKVIYESFPPKEKGMIMRIMNKVDNMQSLAIMGQLNTKTTVIDSLTAETFAMLCQAKPLLAAEKSADTKGRRIAGYRMTGPAEYGFEADTTYNLLASLRSIPGMNLIVTAHLIDRYGKENPDDEYSESVVVGERLSVRDKIAENVPVYFDHIFRFDKRTINGKDRFTVKFRGDICRTTFVDLPDGEIDITGVNFYEKLMSLIKKV